VCVLTAYFEDNWSKNAIYLNFSENKGEKNSEKELILMLIEKDRGFLINRAIWKSLYVSKLVFQIETTFFC